MAFRGLRVLAVVPARGGSKGIPRKNLSLVGGRTLIAHRASIIAALPWIDAAILSTDDDEIAAEGLRAGLRVPFRRPAELASDIASSADMWRHAWLSCESAGSTAFDASVLLEPTSPLRMPEDVEHTLATMIEGGHAAAATLSPTPAHFAPGKALVLDGAGHIDFYAPPGMRATRRQDLNASFHRNGVCYAVKRQTLFERGAIIEHDCAGVVIERPVVNIDEPCDLELAEWLWSKAGRG